MNEKNMRKGSKRDAILRVAILIMAVIAGFGPARAADIFEELAGDSKVESAYISGKFAHNMPTWRSFDGSHAMNLSQGFSALYQYQCYSEEVVNKARKILDNYLKSHPDMELMSRNVRGNEEYSIYERFNSQDDVVQMIIWNKTSKGVCEIVVIDWNKGIPSGSKGNLNR